MALSGNPQRSCLLIIQKDFYSFEKHVRIALTDLGYQVTVANHEYPEGALGKILGKLQVPYIFSSTSKYLAEHYLDNKYYDVVLIIKGRGISASLIELLKKHATQVVGYNYDSFKYNPSPIKWYKLATSYYTFDYKDGDNYNVPVVELFSSTPVNTDIKEIRYEISALVRNHSQRLKYLNKVINILKPNSYFIYIFEQNILTFLVNFVKNPLLYLKYWKYIHFKPLKYSDYNDVIKTSGVTIDYAHHRQTGITIRCYEAINMQTKIISNNTYLSRSKYFNDTNSLIFNINDNEEDLVKSYNRLKNNDLVAKVRDIHSFIEDLIGK
ncbi:hypothetical protein HQ865_17410 [Mucilaginibacter mali]|uniref:Uncharacterized protein n=1 Tax=Mucilaginibacter mali TaxID=2740462 RepID=A0A7D4QV18_9SPHI|nr:hypothetical protein [Mucilaginibacter mali]QKJ31469.1 hypothetical protein HQ865_17410 [Mucilaginibacter mali]